MTTETLHYIAAEASRIEQGSIKRVSCADIRALLAERQALLEALQAVSRLDYLNEHNALAERARNAIKQATT